MAEHLAPTGPVSAPPAAGPSSVLIRLAEPAEYEAVGRLSDAAYSHDYDISDEYRASLHAVAARAAAAEVWVAVDRRTGALLGTVVSPRPDQHISHLGQDGELDFRLLAVAPAARRRGIGRLLVEHVIALAAQRGAIRVVMNSGPQMTGAHQLYYSMGFTRLTERETVTVGGHDQPLLAFGYDLPHPLDDPIRASLTGPHARFAERRGNVLRYPADVAPFLSLPGAPEEADWADAAALVGPGGLLPLPGLESAPPAGWDVQVFGQGVQLTGEGLRVENDPEAVKLGPGDVADMLDLVGRTRPGPFLPRTHELGTYLGIRVNGKLVAMAGERMHPPGWTEISAVCTDDAFRGQGLATRLVRAVGAVIRARGDIPFLHAVATNVNAIRLYEQLGFRLRRTSVFSAVRVPLTGPA